MYECIYTYTLSRLIVQNGRWVSPLQSVIVHVPSWAAFVEYRDSRHHEHHTSRPCWGVGLAV
jgi:hypothetical protein